MTSKIETPFYDALDERYCDVIVNRYIDWCKKNEKAYSVKLNGEVYEWVDH